MTWPSSADKTHLDQATDDPKQARGELATLVDKFNELRSHVTSFMQTLLDDTDAATARATLGVGKTAHTRKTTDQTVNNSTTVVDDSELKYALAGSEAVKFELMLYVTGNDTADLKIAFDIPTGATMLWGVVQPGTGDGKARLARPGTSTLNGVGTNSSFENFIVISGWVDNGGTGGDLQFRWAQSVADASDTIVKTGSTLTVWTF